MVAPTLRGTSFAAPLVAARLAAYQGKGRLWPRWTERRWRGADGPARIVCNLCRKGI
jgi:hypothetical protein